MCLTQLFVFLYCFLFLSSFAGSIQFPVITLSRSSIVQKGKDGLSTLRRPIQRWSNSNTHANVRDFTHKGVQNVNEIKSNITSTIKKKIQNDRKKVLILMSDTGGGHRASAQAIDLSLHQQFPGKIDVDILDIWTDHANWPFNRFVPTYRYVAKHPTLWKVFYAYGNFGPTKLFTETWSWMNSYGRFKNAIASRNPDLVVSVHPLCQLMPIWVVEQMNQIRDKSKPKIPFITVVTDLGGAHGTWFDRRADALFVPSDQIRKIAAKTRIQPNRIIQRGLPIRPAFWKRSKPKETMRKMLGLDTKRKTVLLMGGGDGVGGLGKIANEVADQCGEIQNMDSQVIIVCGNNKKLVNELSSNKYPDNVKVIVKGFVNNVDELMGASDCIVTKAGPGTIAEAMTRGLPIVLSSYLPGQEAGNVPYVVDGGFGLYPGPKPRKIARTVANLLTNDEMRARMSEQALKISRPDATQEIARDIGNIVLRKTSELNLAKLPRE